MNFIFHFFSPYFKSYTPSPLSLFPLLCRFFSSAGFSHFTHSFITLSHYLPPSLKTVSLPLWIVFISMINLSGLPKYSTHFLMRHTQTRSHAKTNLGAMVQRSDSVWILVDKASHQSYHKARPHRFSSQFISAHIVEIQ